MEAGRRPEPRRGTRIDGVLRCRLLDPLPPRCDERGIDQGGAESLEHQTRGGLSGDDRDHFLGFADEE
eukprot:10707200-Prorocentrum_lima.AAC.1